MRKNQIHKRQTFRCEVNFVSARIPHRDKCEMLVMVLDTTRPGYWRCVIVQSHRVIRGIPQAAAWMPREVAQGEIITMHSRQFAEQMSIEQWDERIARIIAEEERRVERARQYREIMREEQKYESLFSAGVAGMIISDKLKGFRELLKLTPPQETAQD